MRTADGAWEPFDAPGLRQRLGETLAAIPGLTPVATGGEALAAEIWLSQVENAGGGRDLLLVVEIEVPPSLRRAVGEPRLSTRVLLERAPGEDGASAPLADDIIIAARRALEVVDARMGLSRGDIGALDALLQSDDPELLLMALEWVRDHKPKVHAEHIVALLSHKDPQVARLAVESLGVVGSPQHAGEIVKRAHLVDPDHTREVYRALAAIGGPDAAGFLEFAAGNEDDPMLRREAELAASTVRGAPERHGRISIRGHRP